MPRSARPERTLDELLADLEEAVASGNTWRAEEIQALIERRLAAEAAERSAIERRVLELMSGLILETRGWRDVQRGPVALGVPPSRGSRDPRRGTEEIDEDRGDRGDRGDRIVPVWFGTNRKPGPGGSGFTSERHDRITRGRVNVFVPEAHRFGEIGTSLWRRLLRLDFRDDRLRVQEILTRERDRFFSEIQEAMHAAARENGGAPQALFFLHGYNVSFEDAAIRAAQLGCDLAVPGATAFFSWPSRGSVLAYTADEASIEASERAITEFLVDFATHCGAERVHLIAHSMGNRGLLRALQRIAGKAETRSRVRFGQIFLAAPDIDRDLFLDLAELYPEHSDRTTLYSSNRDRAVHLSSKFHDAPRAGYFTPYTVAPRIDTIAVPDFDIDLLGHSYFAQAEALLHDMFDLLRHGEPPNERQRLAPREVEGLRFWQVRR